MGFVSAVEKARKLDLHPGGHVLGQRLQDDEMWRVAEDLRGRLLSEREVVERLDVKDTEVRVWESSTGMYLLDKTNG